MQSQLTNAGAAPAGASEMCRVQSAGGASVTYLKEGSGPPLVLVHGGFSNEVTNWEFVLPMLREHFTVYAIARRGRGGTDATEGHTIEQEALDVIAVMEQIPGQVFLLGHSYGALCALAAALRAPGGVAKLVVYEAPWPELLSGDIMGRLGVLVAKGQWDEMAFAFFRDALRVPLTELEALRNSELWAPIAADAKATWQDLLSLRRYEFVPERFRGLGIPVLLQTGSESPDDLYVTGALRSVLTDARIGVLDGQAHEGMTTAPEMYAQAVTRFLLEDAGA